MFKRVILFILSFVLFFASCKSENKAETLTTKPKSQPQAQVEASTDLLADTLLYSLPDKTVGFYFLDFSHPAYKKYKSSKWYIEGSSLKSSLSDLEEYKSLKKALSGSGVDVEDPEFMEKVFEEFIAFATPKFEGSFGAYFKSSDEIKLAKLLVVLREELDKDGYKTQDESYIGASGFSFLEKRPSLKTLDISEEKVKMEVKEGTRIFIAKKEGENRVALTSDKELLNHVISVHRKPQILDSERYKKASRDFPSFQMANSLAYIDFESISNSNLSSSMKSLNRQPFSAVAMAASMKKTPELNLRLLLDPAKQGSKQFISQFDESSAAVVNKAQSKPALFSLSLDTKMILEQAKAYLQQADYDLVKDVDRLLLSARVAPLGQSMLPIPEILMVMQSKKGKMLSNKLLALSSGLLSSYSGGQQLREQTKSIEKYDVRYLLTPLGFGLFVCNIGELVLAASTESQIKYAINAYENKELRLASSISENASKLVNGEPDLAQLYVDFREVAELSKSMGGLLAMYAPPNTDTSKFVDEENMRMLKQLGQSITKFSLEKDAILVKSHSVDSENP